MKPWNAELTAGRITRPLRMWHSVPLQRHQRNHALVRGGGEGLRNPHLDDVQTGGWMDMCGKARRVALSFMPTKSSRTETTDSGEEANAPSLHEGIYRVQC